MITAGVLLAASAAIRSGIRKDGCMNPSDGDALEKELEQASIDSAIESEQQHDLERDAAHKQAEIEKDTREGDLDEG